ncbi:SDR family NAD(P)-dependent oxidoreductase [Enterocloster aldenensis]|uniref:SDR family NAD(P)-dependent oxidoreductase n=1 Tax=Enterocloster aldenensis TaxID=358742 RepID=UPI00402A3028
MFDLKGKTALVTGGAKGIGEGISMELARCGANVIVNYHTSSDGKAICAKLSHMGAPCIAVQADVTDKTQVDSMIAQGMDVFGGIDILVNNAAYQCNIPFDEYDDQNLSRIFHTNLYGYILCMQGVLPYMKERRYGKIINISSVHAKRPTNFDPGYSMTKGAIKMLTRESALELAEYHINVNSAEYGYVDIGVKSGRPRDVVDSGLADEEHVFRFSKLSLADRINRPKDAAHVVAFLASDEADMIHGTAIRADSGTILA